MALVNKTTWFYEYSILPLPSSNFFFSEQFKDLLFIKTKLIILWFIGTPKIA